jgi:glucosamine-6-phosphate deaminase
VPPAITIYIGRTNALAALVADRIAVSVQRRDRALLALATGSTPLRIGLWDELARRCDDGVLDLSTATFINPDEWLGLPKAHPESYASYVDRHIASRIRTNVIVPDGMSSTAVDDARTLDARIAAAGGFDFALLGLGINGHVGFFEPDVAGLPSQAYTPVIADVNRARYAADHFDGDMSAVPTHAVSIGLATVMRSRELCLVVVGEQKAPLVQRALLGPVTTLLPASLVQLAANALVVLDDAAASCLDLAELRQRPGWCVRHL